MATAQVPLVPESAPPMVRFSVLLLQEIISESVHVMTLRVSDDGDFLVLCYDGVERATPPRRLYSAITTTLNVLRGAQTDTLTIGTMECQKGVWTITPRKNVTIHDLRDLVETAYPSIFRDEVPDEPTL